VGCGIAKELKTKLRGNAKVERNLANYLDKPYAAEGNKVFNDKSWNLGTGHPEYEATSAPNEGGKEIDAYHGCRVSERVSKFQVVKLRLRRPWSSITGSVGRPGFEDPAVDQ
jgi:hypothetical protein